MTVTGISVAGLGKLGLCMAACFADKGYRVVGVDVNPDVVEAVNRGESPLCEPGLADLLSRLRGQLVATSDYREAMEGSQVTFIVVPTPSRPDGTFSTQYVEQAAREIGTCLRWKNDFHTVVLTSTVLPGETRGTLRPLLEAASQKRCGLEFGLCYNPELIALGSVIRDFSNPEVAMIGESDLRSGETVAGIYRNVCENSPTIVRTSFENVELAKIALNSFVTMKISFANTLAAACERLPTGDVDVVSHILGLDSRIGARYLKGGLGFGGPCFPRDNKAFASFARRIGCQARLAEASDEVNRSQTARLLEKVRGVLGTVKGRRIAVLGLTYKPDTDISEASQSLEIAGSLREEGASLTVYDPAGMARANGVLGPDVKYAGSAQECLQGADLCLLTTPWEEFRNLEPQDFLNGAGVPLLLDCWRLLRTNEFPAELQYLGVGLGSGGLEEPVPAGVGAQRGQGER